MKLLMAAGNNALTTIKFTDCVAKDILLNDAHAATTALTKQTNLPKKPHIDTQAEVKVKADDHNYAIQATIGNKEGMAEAITSIVSSNVTDPIIKHTDGSQLSGPFLTVASATKHPTKCKMVALKVNLLLFTFYWRKSFQINMEQLGAQVNNR